MKNRLHILYLAIIAFSLLIGWGGWAGYAQRNYPGRQNWEYRFILREGGPGNWVSVREDGKYLDKPVDMISKSQELGVQGWELVTVTPRPGPSIGGTSGGTVEELWVFKRPRP